MAPSTTSPQHNCASESIGWGIVVLTCQNGTASWLPSPKPDWWPRAWTSWRSHSLAKGTGLRCTFCTERMFWPIHNCFASSPKTWLWSVTSFHYFHKTMRESFIRLWPSVMTVSISDLAHFEMNQTDWCQPRLIPSKTVSLHGFGTSQSLKMYSAI